MIPPRISVQRVDPYGVVATTLIAELIAELSRRYADGDDGEATSFHPRDATVPRSAFVVATWDGEPVGCGAVRPMSAELAEIKRMYVQPQARGLGVGRAIVTELERLAREFGYSALKLETGKRQPEAIALYASRGFVQVEPYGEYKDNPMSVCFRKELGFREY